MNSEQRRNRTASLSYEEQYYAQGFSAIVGMDEAGRGPWAGPVVVGAVALPLERTDLRDVLRGVRDSKQMTPRQRSQLAETIKQIARAWGVGSTSAAEINALGLAAAISLAMQRALDAAVQASGLQPDYLLLDHVKWKGTTIPQINLTHGDQLSLSIAAASILAKTWRDTYMHDLHQRYPDYGFASHKGYGTAAHRAALEQYGICPEHRTTYAPIMALMK
jgi:ribonuclease HII